MCVAALLCDHNLQIHKLRCQEIDQVLLMDVEFFLVHPAALKYQAKMHSLRTAK